LPTGSSSCKKARPWPTAGSCSGITTLARITSERAPNGRSLAHRASITDKQFVLPPNRRPALMPGMNVGGGVIIVARGDRSRRRMIAFDDRIAVVIGASAHSATGQANQPEQCRHEAFRHGIPPAGPPGLEDRQAASDAQEKSMRRRTEPFGQPMLISAGAASKPEQILPVVGPSAGRDLGKPPLANPRSRMSCQDRRGGLK
jgi:hypothetical protein